MFDKLLLIGKVWYVVSFSRMLFYKELLTLQYSKMGFVVVLKMLSSCFTKLI